MKTMEKELRKLNRADLLELYLQERRENDELRARLAEVEKQLSDRRIAIENAGSLAEATLLLNGVVDAVEAACAQYIDNVMAKHGMGPLSSGEGAAQEAGSAAQDAGSAGRTTGTTLADNPTVRIAGVPVRKLGSS